MRLIGHLKNEASAKTFSGYLVSKDIRNLVEQDAEGWAVWIHSEDQLEEGQLALAAYVQNPNDQKYHDAFKAAETLEREQRREGAKAAKRIHGRDRIWARSKFAPLTLCLIGISVVVTLPILLDSSYRYMSWLAISHYVGAGFLPEVRSGQVWRLITPIFIHFTPWHLLFNMFMLRDLGTMIEVRQGTVKLAALVVVLGVASNIGQYLLAGPGFGGMSGVLYGLFGYIWLRSQCDPDSGLGLSTTTVWLLVIWFFLCLSGYMGNVANGTHVVGFILGMIWGAAPMARRLFRG